MFRHSKKIILTRLTSIISQTIFIKELIKKILLKFSKQTYLNVVKNWQINTRQIKLQWM